MKKFMRISAILLVLLLIAFFIIYVADTARLKKEAARIDFNASEITENRLNENDELIPYMCIEYDGHKYLNFSTSLYCYDKAIENEPLAIVRQTSLKKSVDEIKCLYGFEGDRENCFVYYDVKDSSRSVSCLYFREDLNIPKLSSNDVASIVIVDSKTETNVFNIKDINSVKQILSAYCDMSRIDRNEKTLEYLYSNGFIDNKDSDEEYEVRAYFSEFPNLYFSLGNVGRTEDGIQEFSASFIGDLDLLHQ